MLVKILIISVRSIAPFNVEFAKQLTVFAACISSVPGSSLDVHGDSFSKGRVGVDGDLLLQADATVKVKSIDFVEIGTSVQLGGDLDLDFATIIFVDSLSPQFQLDTPMRAHVDGDLLVDPYDAHSENLISNWRIKTKYLGATAGSISARSGVASNLEMLSNRS